MLYEFIQLILFGLNYIFCYLSVEFEGSMVTTLIIHV